ncbi:CAAX prenyl protease 1 [Achlya hypogyna]|uniref:CAAX prenyl protease n=1 Tax=Achlya hypogyna TaxID=1202772 RepID=A0A1V9ZMS9_ACHHY|nr:CAAX prenyl protease 1 [Achlya hypogyna]
MLVPWFTEAGWQPSTVPYLEGTLLFIVIIYLSETYLDYRQHSKLHERTLPPKLAAAIAQVDEFNAAKKAATPKKPTDEAADTHDSATPEDAPLTLLAQTEAKFEKSRLYSLDKSTFGFISDAIQELDSIVLLLAGYLPYVWSLSGRIVAAWGVSGEIPQSLVFVSLTMAKDLVFQLPFGLYSTFVIEARHGFNKQTLGLFLADKAKGTLVSIVVGFPLLSALIFLVRWGGDNFVFYVWLLTVSFTLLMLTIYPVWIMPLFNTFTPLPAGPLRTRIEALASQLAFPLTQLFVCDGSKRSSHSNAYMYGFFKSKRIVLFDTLLAQATDDEVVAILGHELGHWKLWHTIQGFVFQQVYVVAMFAVFGRCMHDTALFTSFGFSPAEPLAVMIGLTLFSQTLWAPVDKALTFLLTLNTRRNEFQADAFAVDLNLGDALQSGLTKISLENLANMNPDELYSAYHYSHPPLVERLAAIGVRTKKMQ